MDEREAKDERQLLTVRDVATRVNVSRETVRLWIVSGLLLARFRQGEGRRTCIRIDPRDLDDFLSQWDSNKPIE